MRKKTTLGWQLGMLPALLIWHSRKEHMVKHMLLSISLAGRSGPILFRSLVTNIPILPSNNGSELREKAE